MRQRRDEDRCNCIRPQKRVGSNAGGDCLRSRVFLATLLAAAFAVGSRRHPGLQLFAQPGHTRRRRQRRRGHPARSDRSPSIRADVTLDLVQGQPPPTQAFNVTLHGPDGDMDVTGASTFALTDLTVGAMNLNAFTATTDHGGTTQLIALRSSTPSATARRRSRRSTCACTAASTGPTARPAAARRSPATMRRSARRPAITPQIFYPNDGVLLPPNMEVVAVHFTPFPGGPPAVPITEFEIDFANSNTDVRVTTHVLDAAHGHGARRRSRTGGCEYKLDPTVWDFIAKSNRGGDAVKITVRATTDGMCATSSMNSVNVAFGEQDVNGGIFYWKSSITTRRRRRRTTSGPRRSATRSPRSRSPAWPAPTWRTRPASAATRCRTTASAWSSTSTTPTPTTSTPTSCTRSWTRCRRTRSTGTTRTGSSSRASRPSRPT